MMMKTWSKCGNHFFRYVHLTSLHNKFLYTGYFSHILHLDIIKSEINFKLKVKMNNEQNDYIRMVFNGNRP